MTTDDEPTSPAPPSAEGVEPAAGAEGVEPAAGAEGVEPAAEAVPVEAAEVEAAPVEAAPVEAVAADVPVGEPVAPAAVDPAPPAVPVEEPVEELPAPEPAAPEPAAPEPAAPEPAPPAEEPPASAAAVEEPVAAPAALVEEPVAAPAAPVAPAEEPPAAPAAPVEEPVSPPEPVAAPAPDPVEVPATPELASAVPAPDVPDVPDVSEEAEPAPDRRHPVLARLPLVLLALLLIGALVAWLGPVRDWRQAARRDERRSQAVSQSGKLALYLSTVRHDKLDEDLRHIAEITTGEAHKEFAESLFENETYKKLSRELQAVITGKVVRTALVPCGTDDSACRRGDEATVIVFVDQSRSNKVNRTPRVERTPYVLTLVRRGDTWLISEVELI